jgi:hypothetical protein
MWVLLTMNMAVALLIGVVAMGFKPELLPLVRFSFLNL